MLHPSSKTYSVVAQLVSYGLECTKVHPNVVD